MIYTLLLTNCHLPFSSVFNVTFQSLYVIFLFILPVFYIRLQMLFFAHHPCNYKCHRKCHCTYNKLKNNEQQNPSYNRYVNFYVTHKCKTLHGCLKICNFVISYQVCIFFRLLTEPAVRQQ